MTTAPLPPAIPVDLQQPISQLLELKAAIAAADRGEFASDDEANTFFAQYGA